MDNYTTVANDVRTTPRLLTILFSVCLLVGLSLWSTMANTRESQARPHVPDTFNGVHGEVLNSDASPVQDEEDPEDPTLTTVPIDTRTETSTATITPVAGLTITPHSSFGDDLVITPQTDLWVSEDLGAPAAINDPVLLVNGDGTTKASALLRFDFPDISVDLANASFVFYVAVDGPTELLIQSVSSQWEPSSVTAVNSPAPVTAASIRILVSQTGWHEVSLVEFAAGEAITTMSLWITSPTQAQVASRESKYGSPRVVVHSPEATATAIPDVSTETPVTEIATEIPTSSTPEVVTTQMGSLTPTATSEKATLPKTATSVISSGTPGSFSSAAMVRDPELRSLKVQSVIRAGGMGKITVCLTAAPRGGSVFVKLSVNRPSVMNVPEHVRVWAGKGCASIAVDAALVKQETTVKVIAVFSGTRVVIPTVVRPMRSAPTPTVTATEVAEAEPSETGTPTRTPSPTMTATPESGSPSIAPIRAAFYYPWFPEAWKQKGITPYSNFEPSIGYYSGDDLAVVQSQIAAMQYGNIEAGIVSWWGQDHKTDGRVPLLLTAAEGTGFKWAIYYELESQGNPSADTISSDLAYIKRNYTSDPAYLKIDGRPVIFVYSSGTDSCSMVKRWIEGNSINAYVVLKVYTGYKNCSYQPDNWHKYAPANPADELAGMSYSISPGFWKVGEGERLDRDLDRWNANIRAMINSDAPFQLVISFNEWGEGTSVESAAEWETSSGYGAYLDALHFNGQGSPTDPTPTQIPPDVGSVTLLAAGDIAACGSSGDEATGLLLDKHAGTIAVLGDIAYDSGTQEQFDKCFDPSWGRHKDRIRPAIGNHEYLTDNGLPYWDYFGSAAGTPGQGWYSYELGEWTVYVLNSQCSRVGCRPGSEQYDWLQNQIAADVNSCSLAYFHHPAYSSGDHGNTEGVQPLWDLLYSSGVEVALVGHDHIYERFAPMDADGNLDRTYGIREFVVGTGGKSHNTFPNIQTTSEVREANTFGVLKMSLLAGSYSWEFLPVAGKTFTDQGTGKCHGRPPAASSGDTSIAATTQTASMQAYRRDQA